MAQPRDDGVQDKGKANGKVMDVKYSKGKISETWQLTK